MKSILDLLSNEVGNAFEKAGYKKEAGRVSVSNRPDLCEYQCNGAMALAKEFKCAPKAIADAVVEVLKGSSAFESVEAVMPGFINMNISASFLSDYVKKMAEDDKYGIDLPDPKTIVVDYGGPNVAKALHVGHLRPAIIGESIKRILRYMGHNVIGDVHMGDWGKPMGLVMVEIQERQPDLPYFDESYTGEYPKEPPFTVRDLEEIYPTASAKSKEDPDYNARALETTLKLQSGVRGYRALWEHIINVSVNDMKHIYERLHVDFDLWNGESTVQYLIPDMVKEMKESGVAYESEGALVIDVKEDTDTKEIPPCIVVKSDGASLYNTTDLATIKERVAKYDPAQIIYITDKRQDLYFEQVFRAARKAGLVSDKVTLSHIGFGTMNGKDGKPFKTRDGGVMRLESLITEIQDEMYSKIKENKDIDDAEARQTADLVGLSALLYGDLSNQAVKDYVFDMERFISFEGNTGPYILYTIVRIKSIIAKYAAQGGDVSALKIGTPVNASEKDLMKALSSFAQTMDSAATELAPHRICAYIYDLANALNSFYHETKILSEEDEAKKGEYIALIDFTRKVLETCIDMLGFSAPDRM
ncbi:MAG: arginine--tRNA ligase [Lachnospiraceae bacterium]|nr:arginine--tRNA ligase [Lachnospiraceae bacterium]MBP5761957.1 arginine--tRNA ligase [Lachnospiraceae bacterium]